MKLIGVGVEVKAGNLRIGSLLFACGLRVDDIHFFTTAGSTSVSYPSIKDKQQLFHPSFAFIDEREDESAKNLLLYAWRQTMQNGGRSVCGVLKEDCEKDLGAVTPDDLDWSDRPLTTEYPFTGIRQFLLRVDFSLYFINCAYAKVQFGNAFVISNVKITCEGEKRFFVRFPRMAYNAERSFLLLDDDRQYVEDALIDAVAPHLSVRNDRTIDEEELLQMLWSACKNGYLLQSRLAEILNRNRVDWRNSFHVSTIAQLIEKMSFLSVKRLEPEPGKYVNWVSISHNKGISPVSTAKATPYLSDELKEELHVALRRECETEGRLNLAQVIPLLSAKYPDLVARLPNVKLKSLLLECDFVELEGGPMPPLYMRVTDAPTVAESQDAQDAKPCAESADNFPAQQGELPTLAPAEPKKAPPLIARSNPFAVYPHTKLIVEHALPNSTISEIRPADAMKRYSMHSLAGHMDFMDLEIVYWVSNMQYSKTSFLMDLIKGGFIETPPGKEITPDKLNKRLMRLYETGFLQFFRLCSLKENGDIDSIANFRVLMISPHAHTQLRAIGRQSHFTAFMILENSETIRRKLSVNQWFTKFALHFRDFTKYYLGEVATAQIAVANSARINLIADYRGIPLFVTSIRRGLLRDMEIRSGDFAFWVERITNVLKNYSTLYIGDQLVPFVKKPIVIFLCEDSEHCDAVYRELRDIAAAIKDTTILHCAWFAEDIDIFNSFLTAHYQIQEGGTHIPVSISEFLEVEVNACIIKDDASEEAENKQYAVLSHAEDFHEIDMN